MFISFSDIFKEVCLQKSSYHLKKTALTIFDTLKPTPVIGMLYKAFACCSELLILYYLAFFACLIQPLISLQGFTKDKLLCDPLQPLLFNQEARSVK